MREVIRYEADDGSVHDTADAARERDSQLAAIADAMWGLGEPPVDDPDFVEGRAFVQHDDAAIANASKAICKLYQVEGMGPLLSPAVDRFGRFDRESREWYSWQFVHEALEGGERAKSAKPLAPRLKERTEA